MLLLNLLHIAQLLFLQLLKRGHDYAPPHLILKPELIIRNSSLHRSQENITVY